MLIKFSGAGQDFSPTFLVNTSAVTVDYSYDCSSIGPVPENFTVDMISSSNHDQTIVNTSGVKVSADVTVPIPKENGYFLEVTTACDWSITVRS